MQHPRHKVACTHPNIARRPVQTSKRPTAKNKKVNNLARWRVRSFAARWIDIDIDYNKDIDIDIGYNIDIDIGTSSIQPAAKLRTRHRAKLLTFLFSAVGLLARDLN